MSVTAFVETIYRIENIISLKFKNYQINCKYLEDLSFKKEKNSHNLC